LGYQIESSVCCCWLVSFSNPARYFNPRPPDGATKTLRFWRPGRDVRGFIIAGLRTFPRRSSLSGFCCPARPSPNVVWAALAGWGKDGSPAFSDLPLDRADNQSFVPAGPRPNRLHHKGKSAWLSRLYWLLAPVNDNIRRPGARRGGLITTLSDRKFFPPLLGRAGPALFFLLSSGRFCV